MQRKLDRLNRAREPRDLADPPGNRMAPLKGGYAGYFSIRINDQYRIVFRSERSDAREVQMTDTTEERVTMLPKDRAPTASGEMLLEEFLNPNGITQVQLAARMGVPIQRVNTIINGKRGITADMVILLAEALDTTPGVLDGWDFRATTTSGMPSGMGRLPREMRAPSRRALGGWRSLGQAALVPRETPSADGLPFASSLPGRSLFPHQVSPSFLPGSRSEQHGIPPRNLG